MDKNWKIITFLQKPSPSPTMFIYFCVVFHGTSWLWAQSLTHWYIQWTISHYLSYIGSVQFDEEEFSSFFRLMKIRKMKWREVIAVSEMKRRNSCKSYPLHHFVMKRIWIFNLFIILKWRGFKYYCLPINFKWRDFVKYWILFISLDEFSWH